MRLKRKHSRVLAFAIVILFIGVAVLIGAKHSVRGPRPSFELLKNKDGTIDASVVFGEFKKSEIKNGKKLWEVIAKVGKYRPLTGMAELQEVTVTLFKEDDTIHLTSHLATVVLNGTELRDVTATGDVVIISESRETKISTDSIAYEKNTDRISTDARVRIESPEMILLGKGMEGNAALKSFSIKEDVETILKAKVKNKEVKGEKKKK